MNHSPNPLAVSQLGSEKKQRTGSKSHCPDRVLSSHSITHPRRIYLERKTPGRRARGRRSQGLRVWDLRLAPSAERGARAACRGAERGRGRQGPVPTACRLWKALASLRPAPRSCTDSASPRFPLLQRSKPPFTPCLGLARLSASAGRRALRLSRHLDLTSPSSIPPSVSRRDGHLSRYLGLCVSGVSVALIVSAASLSSRACVPSSPPLPLWLPLPSFVSASADPGIIPHTPPASLPISASVSVGLPHCPRAPGAPLRDSPPPSLSGSFPALAPSAQAWQVPVPCQVAMKTLATRKLLAFPVRKGVLPPRFPTPSVPW